MVPILLHLDLGLIRFMSVIVLVGNCEEEQDDDVEEYDDGDEEEGDGVTSNCAANDSDKVAGSQHIGSSNLSTGLHRSTKTPATTAAAETSGELVSLDRWRVCESFL